MKVDTLVIYRKQKHSRHPSPKAINLHANEHGEDYDYFIKKYWIIDEVNEHEYICTTRTGKRITVKKGDPNLRKANIFERIILKNRFPIH